MTEISHQDVIHEGTFSATYDTKTYMGVRFNVDRAYLLKRMLKAEMFRNQNKDLMLSFAAIPREGEPLGRHTIGECEWYVFDTEGRIYIMSDDDIKQLKGIKPLSFDWHLYDIFPRKLEMLKHYNDARYEVEFDR